jgi:CDP-6-deoxy-D-xylo-4-hexulose-3-dehydrase
VLGRKVVLTCNSGSSANLLAMTALTSPELGDNALQPGDEVITCATGFPTTVNPSFNNNLVPVFLDVDIPTYNIKTEALEEALSPRTRAIMVAHTLGNPFDLKTIMDFAKKHDLYVVEDTCDALGAEYDGKKVGTFGDIGTLSFYPAHHITMGEGGAVYCDSPKLKRALECLRDWGRDCWCDSGKDNTCQKRFEWQLGELPYGFDHKYTYSHLGYNLKITDMQAAVGLAQIPRIGEFVEARRQNYAFLRKQLEALEACFILPEATPNSNPSWFGFPLTVRKDAGFTRDDLVKHLNDKKIGTRLLFGGNLLRQPYMLGRNYRTAGEIVNADIVMNDTFWIGVYPGLNEESLGYMFEVIDGFIKNGA